MFRLGAIVRIWLKGGDFVKSTTRWPRIVLSHVETTQTALENTQTHTDYQDYNNKYSNKKNINAFLTFTNKCITIPVTKKPLLSMQSHIFTYHFHTNHVNELGNIFPFVIFWADICIYICTFFHISRHTPPLVES